MPTRVHAYLLLSAALVTGAGQARAQQTIIGDQPAVAPERKLSPEEANRLEARKLYALALLQQRDDCIIEAVRTLEQAVKLDPEAAPLYRALAPLYLALSRLDEGLAACKKAVELEPADFETWFLFARQLRERGELKEAANALTRAASCPKVMDHLELYMQIHFDLGGICEETRSFKEAESAYTEVARILEKTDLLLESLPYTREQIKAEAARTYERIGRVCIQSRRYVQAEAAFRRAQEKDPEGAGRLNYHLAEVSLAQNKLDQALRFLDAYLLTQPPGAEAYEMRIKLLGRLGRATESLPALLRFAERDPHNVPLQLLTARQLAQERRPDEAEDRYKKLADANPTPEVYRGLFLFYKDQGRVEKVLDLLDTNVATAAAAEKAEGPEALKAREAGAAAAVRARAMLAVLRDEPELVKLLLRQATEELKRPRERQFETRRFLAVLAARTKQLDTAELLFRECLKGLTRASESEIYSGLLDVLWEARKHKEIVRLCRDGLDRTQATNHAMFHVNLALALVQLGQADEALAAAGKAVELADQRNRLRLRRIRASILSQLGRHDQAIAECQALLKEYSEPAEVRDIRYALANVWSTAKKFDKAEEQLRRILDIDPNDATVNNDLGYIMADQGKNLDEAEQLIRKAVDLDLQQKKEGTRLAADDERDSANPAYLDSLGWVLFRKGLLDEARAWLEKASRLPGGEDPVIWDHLGDVYMKLDQAARARSAWQKALELYELDKRRRLDDHHNELKAKLKLLGK